MVGEYFFDGGPKILDAEAIGQKIRDKLGFIVIDDTKDFFEAVKENVSWLELSNIFNLSLIIFCIIGVLGYLLDVKILSSVFTLLVVFIGAFKMKKK